MSPEAIEQLKNDLRRSFERHEVRLAYLFGSQATGNTHPNSDTDIAVVLPRHLGPKERFAVRLELTDSAARACGSDDVDVVILNEAPPLLRFEVLRDGIILYSLSDQERIDYQVRTCANYEDTAPLRSLLARTLRDRIRSGTFGRKVRIAGPLR